jgi:hypothetical protein
MTRKVRSPVPKGEPPLWRLLARETRLTITPAGIDLLVAHGLLSSDNRHGWEQGVLRVFQIKPIPTPRTKTKGNHP